jgi:hypothetical protein
LTHSPARSTGPLSFNEALKRELDALRPGTCKDFTPEAQLDREVSEADWLDYKRRKSSNLRQLYRLIAKLGKAGPGDRPLVALCLSGGGIRSATFNLGVLQALARIGLLEQFDYLSSVSGGGYIAGWLKAWMSRAPGGTRTVVESLGSSTTEPPEHPLDPEPKPIDRLREYSNYLTPTVGLFSPDSWAAGATYVRNLILNWLIVLPVLAAVATIPQIAFLVTQTAWSHHSELFLGMTGLDLMVIAAVLLALIASLNIYRYRRGPDPTPQSRIVLAGVLPLAVAALFLATASLWLRFKVDYAQPDHPVVVKGEVWGFIILWCLAIPAIGWAMSEPGWRRSRDFRWPKWELVGLILTGSISAVLLLWLARGLHPYLISNPALYVVFALPALLLLYLVARTLFVAFASFGEGTLPRTPNSVVGAADREWWARLSGWILLFLVGWALVSSLTLFGGSMLADARDYLPRLLAAVGGISGLTTALLAGSGDTPSGRASSKMGSITKRWVVALAAPIFCLSVGILLAYGALWLGRLVTQDYTLLSRTHLLQDGAHPIGVGTLIRYHLVPVILLLLALIMSRFVNVNRFSLHGFYRDRLVRAYLGASNVDRKPNAFTGFDLTDDLKLHTLWQEKSGRPLPVINTALNLVMSQSKLAWQQRKAESFSMTPFFCGNFYEGYRRTEEYGGAAGISLGSAMTISGAAANPNMGYHSSPSITFLMGLFNARLGAWLGNTNQHGNHTYQREGPRTAFRTIFADLFGLTNASEKYINLSDGGHFDNLGVYEMVLRRCRHILLSDAGRDPISALGDLGNAIRKIRIDFGISIEFTDKIRILPKSATEVGLYCAVAEIRYQDVDGSDVPNGTLIYLKPALTGKGKPVPYDVFSYAKAREDFPHESTTDQWFDEAQFESYRALGSHLLMQIVNPKQLEDTASIRVTTFPQFSDAVKEYVKEAPSKTG